MTTNNEVINKLNVLIRRNYDAESGYMKAAEKADDADLKKTFKTFADMRYKFGHELKGEIQNLGGSIDDVKKGTTLEGEAHQVWIDFKTALSSNNDAAVIEEVHRGEKRALEQYRDILASPELPASSEKIIDNHIAQIEEALVSVKELEEQY